MYIIIIWIFSDTHTMVFKHPVRWMLTSCGVNCITMQPRSQQRGCGKLKSKHWIWGFRVFQFNPPLFDFLFGLGRSGYTYIYIFINISACFCDTSCRQTQIEQTGIVSIYKYTCVKTLAVLKVFGLDHHASSIVEVFHPLGTFWAMTIKKKFHAVSPIVLQPHSFLNLSPVQAVLCRWTQEYVVWLRKVWPSHCHPFISNSRMKKCYWWCWWKECKYKFL